ncbi:optineurin isoform 2-T3 [Discoglossus pictus]
MANQVLNHPPVNELVNGHPDGSYVLGNEAEMLEQIHQLILENNNLKETMKMKNQETSSAAEEVTENLKQVKAQVLRLQAEKADLLGIVSELQLKLSNYASEDSFVEVRFAENEASGETKPEKTDGDNAAPDIMTRRTESVDEVKSCMESEEITVRQLLHSLREETHKVEALEKELTAANERITQLEKTDTNLLDKEIQADIEMEKSKEESPCVETLSGEVDALKLKVQKLNTELHDTNEKLNEAELLKRRLQDKCIFLDKRLSENQVDLEEKQQLFYSIKTLELQVESMQSQIKMEQTKTEDEKKQYHSLREEFNKQKSDFEDLKRREAEKMPKAQFNEIFQKLDSCEKALAKKQCQIDEMNGITERHDEALETIGLLRAQIDVYCSDFHAEREARENIHQEKERMATQLAFLIEENEKLKDEIMGRQSIEEFQRRHRSSSSNDGNQSPHLVQRGAESGDPPSLTLFTCPKCGSNAPDMDTLQIHVMDCIT